MGRFCWVLVLNVLIWVYIIEFGCLYADFRGFKYLHSFDRNITNHFLHIIKFSNILDFAIGSLTLTAEKGTERLLGMLQNEVLLCGMGLLFDLKSTGKYIF